jgi:parvulin-like peptidyl-prolyl isomerase
MKMKSLKNKLLRRKPEHQPPSRITNETVAEHRERILAGGRKFKYPVQYARHKLVINTILISLGVVILLVIVGWWQLYPAQNTSNFVYRLTQIIPLAVAEVDGQPVRYSDYLMRYRSSMHFLQQQNQINLNSKDGTRQVEHVKRQSLDEAVANAYATKLAQENDVKVTSEEIDAFIKKERQSQKSTLSEEAFESVVLKGFYDWSVDEYRDVVGDNLLRRHVAFAVDKKARKTVDTALQELKKGAKFSKVVAKYSSDTITKANGGDVGFVPKNTQDPNGLVAAARKLKKHSTSGVITGIDGYYLVKLIDSNDTQVRYARLRVALGEFERKLKAVKADGKVKEYIDVPELTKQTQR